VYTEPILQWVIYIWGSIRTDSGKEAVQYIDIGQMVRKLHRWSVNLILWISLQNSAIFPEKGHVDL